MNFEVSYKIKKDGKGHICKMYGFLSLEETKPYIEEVMEEEVVILSGKEI